MSDVTSLLSAIDAGDLKADDQLLRLVYEELRRLAAEQVSHIRRGGSAGSLVHRTTRSAIARISGSLSESSLSGEQ